MEHKNQLYITNVKVAAHRIAIHYEVSGAWQKYFADRDFFAVYSEDLSGLPESVAVIPFLANVIPIAWYHHGEIFVDTLDQAFYACLPDVLRGYQNMYPAIALSGMLTVQTLENNSVQGDAAGVFFSGGVDSYYSLLQHMEEQPHLLTIWGADIRLDDTEGWHRVKEHSRLVAEQYALPYHTIQSNFRTILDEGALSAALPEQGFSWWHEFQHGIGILSMAAPITYVYGIRKVYMASTCTIDRGSFTCASDPTIDNYVRYHSCRMVHDGYEASRQDKIRFLVTYAGQRHTGLPLRVCWESAGGGNCGVCEKCCRTMTAIYLEDGDPADFGFADCRANSFSAIGSRLKRRIRMEYAAACYWEHIHARFLEKYTIHTCPRAWRWFYRGGVASVNRNTEFRMHCICMRIGRKLRKIMNGVRRRIWRS